MLVRTLCQLWLRRFLWFIFGASFFVLIAFIPSGFQAYGPAFLENDFPVRLPRSFHQEYRVEPMAAFVPSKTEWTLDRYMRNITWYLNNLKTDQLWIQTPEYKLGNLERIVQTLQGPQVVYGEVHRLYQTPGRYKVTEVIKTTWWVSFRFFTLAVLLGVSLGCLSGIVSVRIRTLRQVSNFGALLVTAVPDFLGFVFIWAGSRWLTKHLGITLYTYQETVSGVWNLPFLLLALFPVAYMTRLTYSIFKEIEAEDYIRTARAKGLSQWKVTMGHMLRNALPRLLNGLPLLLNISMSALLVLEWRFNVYGLAWHMVKMNELEMVATIGIAVSLWAVVMDGIIQTIRFLVHPRLREVGE